MAASIRHRGPDRQKIWADDTAEVFLGHTRLSIQDLSSAGDQPMTSAGGRFVMVFNGEIYNHLDLRRELECAGETRWRGHSDTETILSAFEVWGIEEAIKRANGMFALAVWDRHERVLVLSRDRMGEKPLYYGWQGKSFLFGSELKALRAHPSFDAVIDRNALAAFMRYSYVPAPQSIYRGIWKLPPGTLLRINKEHQGTLPEPVRYWSFLTIARAGIQEPFRGSPEAAVNELEEVLGAAVSRQQIADVPLGAFLSGGIDSSLIVALMQRSAVRPVQSFTIGFENALYNEADHAERVARHLGTDHTVMTVTPQQAREVIPLLPSIYDEPFADSSQIPTYLVSRLARTRVTVSLSGDGGDELFGGYGRYDIFRKIHGVPPLLRQLFAAGVTAVSPETWDRVQERSWRALPQSLRARMPGDKAYKLAHLARSRSAPELYSRLVTMWPEEESPVLGAAIPDQLSVLWQSTLRDFGAADHQMMALDSLTYLPDDILCKVDRAAMAVSLETRVPFLDPEVIAFAWQLPLDMKVKRGTRKWILRQLLYRHVPQSIVERPKRGFAVPVNEWLRGPLRGWAEDLLGKGRLRREGYLDPKLVRDRWEDHLTGRRNWQAQLWAVLMFQAWLGDHG